MDRRGQPLVRIENLFFSYNSAQTEYVLKNVNLEIEKGSFTAVLGHNGSGKSTLAKLMNLILTPVEGRIFINGLDVCQCDVYDVRKNVGMVFQNPDNQIVASIVEEDVAFGPENLGVDPAEIRRRVDEALETVGMGEYKLSAPHKLSGGQKQRIAIAGVIAMYPELVILDEATAMLDPAGRQEVLATVKKLTQEKNITVVLITHYMNEAALADRVIVLNKGELYLDGNPKQVFSQFEKLKKAGLDVPQVTELMRVLNEESGLKDNIKLPTDILDEKEAADLLKEYISNIHHNHSGTED